MGKKHADIDDIADLEFDRFFVKQGDDILHDKGTKSNAKDKQEDTKGDKIANEAEFLLAESRFKKGKQLVDKKRENNNDSGNDAGADGQVKELKWGGENNVDTLKIVGA